MQMIAIGGAIGMGLFVGTGSALAVAGPASLWIAFVITGLMLYTVVMALGELAVMYPINGAFNIYSSRFIDPAWGLAMGWNYALQWLIILPLELSAAAMVIGYWNEVVDVGVWIALFFVALVFVNFFGVKGYGNAEVLFSGIKVLACLGFLILGIVIILGGGTNKKTFGHTYSDPGAFANGFPGFCSVFVNSAFAFAGTELVGLAAAEARNPRETLPRASRQTIFRVSVCYVGTLILVGLIVPYNHPDLGGHGARHSPFVIAIESAGIPVLPSIFNFIILIAVLSVGNSSVYATSRTFQALAKYGQAPKCLAYVDSRGRPIVAIVVALTFGLLAFVGEAGWDTRSKVFDWLLSISALSTLFTWLSICWAHIRFRQAWKAQGHTLTELPYVASTGVLGSWFGLIVCALVLIAQFYVAVDPVGGSENHAIDFFQAYLAAPLILVMFIVYKVWHRTPFMVVANGNQATGYFPTETIDLTSGRSKLPAVEEEHLSPLQKCFTACC